MKRNAIILFTILVSLFVVGCARFAGGATNATQPGQPKSGPGGSDYKFAKVKVDHYGEGNGEYWIFEPDSPKPESAPVVAFLHGWSGMNPKIYGAWIEHLVRRGNIVIYPRYQESLKTSPADMNNAAFAAVKDALKQLQQPGHIRPRTDQFSVVGHSLGGAMTGNFAAAARENGLPAVRAAMPVEPGDSNNVNNGKPYGSKIPSLLGDYSKIPSDTLLVCVVGADDTVAGDTTSLIIFNNSKQIPLKNKAFIIVNSDNHGTPPMQATHFFPPASESDFDVPINDNSSGGGPLRKMIKARMKARMESKSGGDKESRGKTDALDYYGTWRLFDALTDCAYYKKNCDIVMSDTPKARYMGKWSDGVPVKELTITKNPKPGS